MKKRLKKILFFSITFLFLFSFSLNVNASVIENDNIVVTSSIKNDFTRNISVAEKKDTCEKILGDPENCDGKCPAYLIQWILDTIKYIAIVALLLLVTVDFLKAVVNNDKDALKKAGTTSIKRFIYCVLIFFVPLIVKLIMNLMGIYGSCGIG